MGWGVGEMGAEGRARMRVHGWERMGGNGSELGWEWTDWNGMGENLEAFFACFALSAATVSAAAFSAAFGMGLGWDGMRWYM